MAEKQYEELTFRCAQCGRDIITTWEVCGGMLPGDDHLLWGDSVVHSVCLDNHLRWYELTKGSSDETGEHQ